MNFLKIKSLMVAVLLLLLAACTSPPEADPAVETAGAVESEEAVDGGVGESAVKTDAASAAHTVDISRYDDLDIITLLPQDAIPAIDNPSFLTADEADDFYDADELVMGVVFNGDARAYSVPHLSRHEIVNDEVGGVKIAVTW